MVVHCSQPGCTEIWQTDADTLKPIPARERALRCHAGCGAIRGGAG